MMHEGAGAKRPHMAAGFCGVCGAIAGFTLGTLGAALYGLPEQLTGAISASAGVCLGTILIYLTAH